MEGRTLTRTDGGEAVILVSSQDTHQLAPPPPQFVAVTKHLSPTQGWYTESRNYCMVPVSYYNSNQLYVYVKTLSIFADLSQLSATRRTPSSQSNVFSLETRKRRHRRPVSVKIQFSQSLELLLPDALRAQPQYIGFAKNYAPELDADRCSCSWPPLNIRTG